MFENDLIIDLSIFVDFGRLSSTSTVVNVFIKNKPKLFIYNFERTFPNNVITIPILSAIGIIITLSLICG